MKRAENVVVSKDGVEGKPIDFDVQSKVEGNESQIVTITLKPGQVLRAESGGKFALNAAARHCASFPVRISFSLFIYLTSS